MIGSLILVVLALVVIGVAAARALRSRRASRMILVFGVVALVFVTSPITVAWANWLGAAAGCGHQPVAASRFAAANTYDLPGDLNYSPGIFPIIVPDYYCTEADAQAHGFSRDPIR